MLLHAYDIRKYGAFGYVIPPMCIDINMKNS